MEETEEAARTRGYISRDRLDPRDASWRTVLPGVREGDALLPGYMPYGALMFMAVI